MIKKREENPEKKVEVIEKTAFPKDVIVIKNDRYFFEGKEIGLDKMAQMLNNGVKIVKEV